MGAWLLEAARAAALAALALNAILDLRGLLASRAHLRAPVAGRAGLRGGLWGGSGAPPPEGALQPLSLICPVRAAPAPAPRGRMGRGRQAAALDSTLPSPESLDTQAAALCALSNQDYPAAREVAFCLEEGDWSTWALLERVQAASPARPEPSLVPPAPAVRVVASPPHPARTGKGNNLVAGAAVARHPWLAWMDADVEPSPGFLQDLAAPLAKQGVGCAFAFPVHRGARGPWAAALALFVNVRGLTDFVPLACGGRRPTFLAGAAVAVRREALDSIGGPEALAGRLADDIRLGGLLARHGWRTCPIARPAWCRVGAVGRREFWSRLRRWLLGARFQVPGIHAASGLRLGALWALACLGLWLVPAGWGAGGALPAPVPGVSPGSWWPGLAGWLCAWLGGCWPGLAAFIAWKTWRAGVAWAAGRVLGEPSTRRWCFLAPAVDLAWAAAWVASWFGRRVEWAGVRYRLGRGGAVERLAQGPRAGRRRGA